jgi:hypothetical protein
MANLPPTPLVDGRQRLALALRNMRRKPVRKDERQVGTGTNEAGPQVETNYPPNAWPEDGDHS